MWAKDRKKSREDGKALLLSALRKKKGKKLGKKGKGDICRGIISDRFHPIFEKRKWGGRMTRRKSKGKYLCFEINVI